MVVHDANNYSLSCHNFMQQDSEFVICYLLINK